MPLCVFWLLLQLSIDGGRIQGDQTAEKKSLILSFGIFIGCLDELERRCLLLGVRVLHYAVPLFVFCVS